MGIFSRRKNKASIDSMNESIDPNRLPKHIAIIMDGNGRWARSRGLPRIEGHRQGANSVEAALLEGVLAAHCASYRTKIVKTKRHGVQYVLMLLST